MKKGLKALYATLLSTPYTYIYTHSEQQQILPSQQEQPTPPAVPTQTKRGCAEALGLASGWAEGKDSTRGSLESSSGASTRPAACQSLHAFAEDASTS